RLSNPSTSLGVLPTTASASRIQPSTRCDASHPPPNAPHGNHGGGNELAHRTHRSDIRILPKRSAASRLRSLCSPLRGLDPSCALRPEGLYRSGGDSGTKGDTTHVGQVAHTQYHGDDRPPYAPVLRVHHDGASRTRLAGHHHAACRRLIGGLRFRGRTAHARSHPRNRCRAARPGGCDGARVAASEISRPSASPARRRSRTRRLEHAAALAVAAPPVIRIHPGRRMTLPSLGPASTARSNRELFRRSHHG